MAGTGDERGGDELDNLAGVVKLYVERGRFLRNLGVERGIGCVAIGVVEEPLSDMFS